MKAGSPLVLAWFAFAMSALLFIVVVYCFNQLFDAHWVSDRGTTILGIGSALAQAIGLLRWVLVIPGLAATYVDPATSPAARDATLVVFDAVHRYGGMVLGEMIGQLLLAAWTGFVAIRLLRSRLGAAVAGRGGPADHSLLADGPDRTDPRGRAGCARRRGDPLAFMGWEAWLAALAVAMGIQGWRDKAGQPAQGPAMPA